ncbi:MULTISPECIES: DUF2076 domain-containing protein [Thiorhodovibrio]|uniref:DUF2076 domain-containing protein n=1 Tax=Thiorhodovibrio TaxID=61593 RepID=UPI00191150EB|nr:MULTISPECIES: DUF2076 domain-containing protein [Thiorhodovibrio]MBK5969818.1 hypothetical protein [Thiorhodovibrio winogradskyi]WPL12138.1 hypothetical protein Thiosp_01894 [Thiorhodovibrio litoralis]
MNDQEREMIEGLFARLRQAETQSGPRDPQAEALVNQQMAEQPAAPYLLAQVVLVQEEGLRQLQQRVEQLEKDLAAQPSAAQAGGFLGGLFGGSAPAASAPPPPPKPSSPPKSSGWSNPGTASARPGAAFANAPGGGFLAGAMQTAMGVGAGVLLGNALGGLFASDHAEAATPEPAPDPLAADPVASDRAPADFAEAPAEAEPPETDGGGLFDGFFDGGFDGGDDF